jgi:hypothetical protein
LVQGLPKLIVLSGGASAVDACGLFPDEVMHHGADTDNEQLWTAAYNLIRPSDAPPTGCYEEYSDLVSEPYYPEISALLTKCGTYAEQFLRLHASVLLMLAAELMHRRTMWEDEFSDRLDELLTRYHITNFYDRERLWGVDPYRYFVKYDVEVGGLQWSTPDPTHCDRTSLRTPLVPLEEPPDLMGAAW